MTENFAVDLRAEYLTRLDDAMRGLPHGVAADIRAGVTEELEGLDAAATAARIAQLGDPGEIARQAHEEVPAAPGYIAPAPIAAPVAPRPPATSTRGFAIAAALTLSFGGFVLPVVGWVVGAVLVSLSALWRTGEKVVAIVVPFVFAVVTVLLVTGWGFVARESSGSSSGSSSGTGSAETVVNPLLPAWYHLIWFAIMGVGILLIPLSGLWLLWRLRGRTAR